MGGGDREELALGPLYRVSNLHTQQSRSFRKCGWRLKAKSALLFAIYSSTKKCLVLSAFSSSTLSCSSPSSPSLGRLLSVPSILVYHWVSLRCDKWANGIEDCAVKSETGRERKREKSTTVRRTTDWLNVFDCLLKLKRERTIRHTRFTDSLSLSRLTLLSLQLAQFSNSFFLKSYSLI